MKLRLVKFGAKTCGPCLEMDRTRLLERFALAHPGTTVLKVEISDEKGKTPKGSEYEKYFDLSDDYGVEQTPSVIVETEASVDGAPQYVELFRVVGNVPLRQFENSFADALEQLEAAKKLGAS